MPLKWIRTGGAPGGWKSDDDDWLAYDEDLEVGRILRIPHGPSEGKWTWSITGISLAAVGHTDRGMCNTQREAAEALRDAWRRRPANARAVPMFRDALKRLNERDGKVATP